MKKTFLFNAFILLTSVALKAQTNTFPTTGNVGIGTTSPTTSLDIVKSSAPFTAVPMQRWDPIVNGYNLTLSNYNSIWGIDYRFTQIHNGTSYEVLTFQAGNVGIGTTSPSNFGNFAVRGYAVINSKNTSGSFSDAINSTFDIRHMLSVVDLSAENSALTFSNTSAVSTDGIERMRITPAGNVGIGTTDPGSYKLAVNGTIHSKSVIIDLLGWPDYVFKKDYQLMPLAQVKSYIDQNQHLPEMPSDKEVEAKGLDVGEMNKLLTKKVEELTLYLIEKDKLINKQQEQIDHLNQQVSTILEKIK